MLTLSDASRPIVEATLPVVGEHIDEIAQCFYKHLFSEHPELLDGLFNRGNQAEGSQQRALAGEIALFASALLNHPEAAAQPAAVPGGTQARLAGPATRAVPGGPRQPHVGDRQRAR